MFRILFCVFCFTLPSAHAQEIDPIFDRLQWVNRVIVLTGPEDDALFVEQVELFETVLDGLEDREVIVVRHEDRTMDKIEGLSPFPFRNRVVNDTEERRYLENRLQTDDDVFSIVLVGLDGDTKQVWNDVTDPQEIFDVIDVMPLGGRR